MTWFIPYIHVRTSAENYSAIFFIFAISILFLKNPSLVFNRGSLKEVSFSSLLLTGVFCGLSFVCRYQMSIPVFFLFLWMIFSRQFQVKHLFTFIIGNLFVLAFSSAIDIISYDEWLFVPWNYFHLNLIEGVAARFSKDPLWFFLKSPLERGFPPVSLFLMIGSFLFWWRNPRNVWTWVTLPFFLAHSLISHKEIRFLNFLYLMTPFLTLFSLAHFLELKKTWQRVSWKLILFVNTAVLVAVCFRSPRLAVNFYDKIQEVRPQSMKLDQANNPFVQVAGLVPHFYLPHLPEITEDSPYVFVEQATVWKKYYQNPHCQLKYSSSPVWIFKWKLDDVLKRSRIWGLFYCPKEISSNEPKNG